MNPTKSLLHCNFALVIAVLYFGELKEICGVAKEQFGLINTVGEFRKFIENKYPDLSKKTYAISVNKIVAKDSDKIFDCDEIALLPPFSGG